MREKEFVRRTKLFIFYVLLLLCLYGSSKWIHRNHSQHLSMLLTDARFTGEKECGSFPCIGATLCTAIHGGFLEVKKQKSQKKYKSWNLYHGKLVDPRMSARYKNCTVRILEAKKCHPGDQCDEFQANEMEIGLKQFRKKICEKLGRRKKCDIITSLNQWSELKQVETIKGILPVELVRGMSTPLTCASQRLVDRIVRRCSNKYGYTTLGKLSIAEKSTLMFKLKIAPGSWIQEVFPAYEGWPFGKTYGACGRMVVHASSGRASLPEMYKAPWKIRVDLALQLLDIAFKLTDNDSRFLIVIHHLTPKDFVVTENGKLKLDNADDVMVVDKLERRTGNKKQSNVTYELPYYSKNTKIPENEICDFKNTDINFFIVCNWLLGGEWDEGLLHHPEEKEELVSEIAVIINICIRGRMAVLPDTWANKSFLRYTAAKALHLILGNVRPCSEIVPYRFPECQGANDAKDLYQRPWFEILR